MYKQSSQKLVHSHSLNDIPEPLPYQTVVVQTPLRIKPSKALASSKINKNLVKLEPLGTKENTDCESPLSAPLKLDHHRRKLFSTTTNFPAISEENTPSSSSVRNSVVQTQTESRSEQVIENMVMSTGRVKMLLKDERTSSNFFNSNNSRRNEIMNKMNPLSNTATLFEASQIIKGLPSTTTNIAAERISKASPKSTTVEFKEISKLEEKLKKIKQTKQITVKDPASMPELKSGQIMVGVDYFKHLVFGPNVDPKVFRKHITILLRGLNYSIKLLRPPPLEYVQSRKVVARELQNKNQKTLLLDLDETLVFACTSSDKPDKVISLGNENDPMVMLKIRPYAKEFLRKMKEHFEIIVFTAARNPYADAVVKELDPENKYISYVLDRKHCLQTKNGFFIKDLRIFKNRDLKNLILVDNLVHSFGFQIDNGVPILEWRGDKDDQELKHLMTYLIEAKKYDDIREYNKEKLRLADLANYTLEEIVSVEP